MTKDWRRHYDDKAVACEQEFSALERVSEKNLEYERRYIQNYLKEFSGKLILDIGSGSGALTHGLEKDYQVVAGDISLQMCRRARSSSTAIQFTGEQIPLKSRLVDVVLCIGVLQLIMEPRQVLREMTRCLQSNGGGILQTINPACLGRKILRYLDPRVREYNYVSSKQLLLWLQELGFTTEIIYDFYPLRWQSCRSQRHWFFELLAPTYIIIARLTGEENDIE